MKGVARVREDKDIEVTRKGYITVASFVFTVFVASAGMFGTFLNLKIGQAIHEYTIEGQPSRNAATINELKTQQAVTDTQIRSLAESVGDLSGDVKDLIRGWQDVQ